MRIKSIELKGFRPQTFANIKKFIARFVDNIQIITGINGSSKSTTLGEISPLPASKPMYYKNGYKKIELEHKGIDYVLISDFSNKNKVHSFIKNGEELNIGGTQPVQLELVNRHLGYTSLVSSILHNETNICSMSKVDRRSLLLSLNPVDLSLVIEKHKYVQSKIRDYKANLKHLYTRKQELESAMLSKEVLEEKYKKREICNNKLQELSNDEFFLNYQLNLYKHKDSVKDICKNAYNLLVQNRNIDFNQYFGISQLEKEINAFSFTYPNIDKQDFSKVYELNSLLKQKRNESNIYTGLIKKSLIDISQASKHLREIELTNDVNTYEKTLNEYQEEYKKYMDLVEPKVIIREEEYDVYIKLRENIINIMNKILSFHINNIISPDSLIKCKKKIDDLNYNKLKVFSYKISQLKSQINEIDKELFSLPKDPKQILDNCSFCDYRRIYISRSVLLKSKKESLLKELKINEQSYQKYQKIKEQLIEFTYEQEEIHKVIDILYNTLEPTSFRLAKTSIINRINMDPGKFENTIFTIIDNYPKIYRKRYLEKEINKLQEQLKLMNKTNLPSIEFIKTTIEKSNEEIAKNKSKLFDLEEEIKGIEIETTGYNNYAELVKKCKEINNNINDVFEYVYIEASKTFYTIELDKVLKQKSELLYSIRELDIELKEQESLVARYQEETVKMITTMEKEKKILEEIEYGISPSTGFPHKNMVEYLNVLINNVNCILDSVWSYPMQIIPLDINDPLDYSFKVMVDEVLVSDISRLSRGQQVIINLAFTISFIINMQLHDYPIFFDEVIEGLDITHTQRALEWLKEIVDNHYVEQMFFINHDAVLNSGFDGSDLISMSGNDGSLPNHVNKYVTIN